MGAFLLLLCRHLLHLLMTKPVLYPLLLRATLVMAGLLLIWIGLDTYGSGTSWSGMRVSQSALTGEYCEFDHVHRFFRQPVNTYSNLVYCWLGILILGIAGHDATHQTEPRPNQLATVPALSALMGVCLVYLGLGSGFFHASLTYVGQRIDMNGTYAVLLTLVGIALYHTVPAATPTQQNYWVLSLVILIVLFGEIALWIPSSQLVPALILLINLLMVIQYVRFRKTYRPGLIVLGFTLVVMAINIRTLDVQKVGCDPHSIWQGHALWHALTALSTFSSYAFFRFTKADRAVA